MRGSRYFIVGKYGVRVWYSPKFWLIGFRKKTNHSCAVLELGPLTIYL